MDNEIQPENRAEYCFKRGYCYFMLNDYDKAKSYLNQAREESGPYQKHAIYYLAYLAYQNGHYEAALEDFLLLKDDPEYRDDVRQYLTQIYFKEGQYEKVLQTAPTLTDSKDPAQLQALRCVAISQYNLNQYEQAADNFDKLLAL